MNFLSTEITLPDYIPVTAWLEHGPFAMWLVRKMKPARIVELGAHYGYSYFAMCQAVKEMGLPTECFAIDTWKGDEHASFYDESVFESVVEENRKYAGFSRLLRKTFAEALTDVEDGSVDLLHVDGRHFYEDVKEDFESWIPKLSTSAIVLFHDTEVLDQSFGVHRYWAEIRENRPSISFRHCHGLGVLFWGENIPEGLIDLVDSLSEAQTREIVIGYFEAASGKLCVEREKSALVSKLDAALADLQSAKARETEAQADIDRLKSSYVELVKSTLDLRELAETPVKILRRPVRSYLVTRFARLAAKLPGLSEKRRKKFVRSAQKRDARGAGNLLSERLQSFNTDLLSSASKVALCWGEDVDGGKLDSTEHSEQIDIIVCVHNALDDVRACLSSIIAKTAPPYRLIIVDDGSAFETQKYLEEFASSQTALLLRNDAAGGYTKASNRGLKSSTAPWAILLNSDVIVPYGWLDEMLKIGNSDSKIGIVGPSSNTASWQSVPELLLKNGDWSDNPLPSDVTIDDMQSIAAKLAPKQGINLPFLNGFAFMIRRNVINDIGVFDEETFGAGYGEENDYCIRARDAGWQLIYAPNAYVFHAQSKSYSTERRLKLADAADQNLRTKHSEETKINPQVTYCRWNLATSSFRARVAVQLEDREKIARCTQKYGGKRVAFAMPAGSAGGGVNVVLQEASVLCDMGVDTWILNLTGNQVNFEKTYKDARTTVLYFDNPKEITKYLQSNPLEFDAVIATAHFTVNWLPETFKNSKPKLGYYIQDFEPYFFKKGDREYSAALETYNQLDRVTGFTKTEWNAEIVARLGVQRPRVIGASVNLELFRPKGRNIESTTRTIIVAMVRFDGDVGRRSPELTIRVLNRLAHAYPDRVKIVIFGSEKTDEKVRLIYRNIIDRGILTPSETAELLRRAEIFLDFSVWQAMGLSAMEAMASGCAVVVPKRGGTTDFCKNEENSLVIDTSDEDVCFAAASRLVEDETLRIKLQQNATTDICAFTQERAVMRMMKAMFEEPE